MGKIVEEKKYFYEINFIRAFACLLVVMVHVSATFYSESGREFTTMNYFLNQISRFGTPTFAIISGFLLYNQAKTGTFILKKFIKSRFFKIVIPFFFWSIFYLWLNSIYHYYAVPEVKDFETLKEFLYYFFTGKSFYHLYFITLVIQFYFLFPFLQLFRSKWIWWSILVTSVVLNLYFGLNRIEWGTGNLNAFLNDHSFLLKWIAFFVIGIMFSIYWGPIVEWVRKHIAISMVSGLLVIIFAVFEYKQAGSISSNRPSNLINLPILMLSGIGLFYLLEKWKWIRNMLLYIGKLSMGIYLVHPLIIIVFRDYFPQFFRGNIWIPFAFISVVLSSILLIKVVLKLPFGKYILIVASVKKTVDQSSNNFKLKKTV